MGVSESISLSEVKAAHERGWSESFAYYIPSPADTKMLSAQYYVDRAQFYLKDLEEQYNQERAKEKKMSSDNQAAVTDGKDFKKLIGVIIGALEFITKYRFREAADSLVQVASATDELRKIDSMGPNYGNGPLNRIRDLVSSYIEGKDGQVR